MHAYDLDTIAGHKLSVKRASDGDVFTTLDGQERNVDHDTLMICDGEKQVGIAGIMGGENSMITDNVKTMVFEAACFDTLNAGIVTKDLVNLMEGIEPKQVNSLEFIQAIRANLEKRLGC